MPGRDQPRVSPEEFALRELSYGCDVSVRYTATRSRVLHGAFDGFQRDHGAEMSELANVKRVYLDGARTLLGMVAREVT